LKGLGFVSGHRFSDAESSSKSIANLGARSAFVTALALLLSTYVLADGASEIYKAKCSACHGFHGAGDTMIGKNLRLRPLSSPEVQNRSDEELFTVISKGKNKMPSFDRKLSPDQIRDLVRHIRSLKK
jgi:mono/diheme cytochrome c family protein